MLQWGLFAAFAALEVQRMVAEEEAFQLAIADLSPTEREKMIAERTAERRHRETVAAIRDVSSAVRNKGGIGIFW